MKIIVFGPTGGTGRELIKQALAAGHAVTALTRNASTLDAVRGLRVVRGDVLDSGAVEHAVSQHDAVLSALGGRPWRSLPICTRAMQNIVGAMARHGARRLVCISTHGAGESRANVGWFARTILFGMLLRGEVADKEAMETKLSKTDLDWIVVRVGSLTNGTGRGVWRVADDGSIYGMGKIARSDVAAFMLAQLTDNTWLRRKPVLVY